MYYIQLIFLYSIQASIESDIIYKIINGSYVDYTDPTYKKPPGNLKKVMCLFRHGERAPFIIPEINDKKIWNDEKGVEAIDSMFLNNGKHSVEIKYTKCKAKTLTLNGYIQTVMLGNHIRRIYGEWIDSIGGPQNNHLINYFSLADDRRIVSLHGVICGILGMNDNFDKSIHDIFVIPESEIGKTFRNFDKNQINVTNIVPKDEMEKISNYFGFNNWEVHQMTELIVASIRNTYKKNNGEFFISLDTAYRLIQAEKISWRKRAILQYKSISHRRKCFYTLGIKLRSFLKDQNKYFDIISVSKIKLMSFLLGLKIEEYERPLFASSIFIEVWDIKGKDFVRIIYNNEICESGFFGQELTPLTEFYQELEKELDETN
ncbi:hypothetical protein TCON_2681 [Astathelohania contejeani]|uniref:Uncharacterized protein n=1 Tax=Astathelohania contejeani TaxID=164912 RepID=A0ABQ7HVB9_9MICR|nr:hypothetical protein TCON_2681 [Thelohania contejeani]